MKILKTIILFLAVLFFRLLPVRPPNVEPILATLMPLGKRTGLLTSVLFASLSMVIYDTLTVGIGGYTWTTTLSYSLVAIGSFFYFQKRQGSIKNYALYSIVAIIFYDLMTGIVLGPLLTGGNVYLAFMGQIPFTALHLMGGVLFSIILSPLVSKFLAWNPQFQHTKRVLVNIPKLKEFE